MLLEFTAQNFLSIKDTITFSMHASKDKDERNVFEVSVGDKKEYKILNSAVIYGANASGKSNLLSAMAAMRHLIINIDKIVQSTDTLEKRYRPFRLSTETENAGTEFEITFLMDNKKYRYGFEYDNEQFYSEWLFIDENGRENKIFVRDVDSGSYVNSSFNEGFEFFDSNQKKINGLRANQLFLWKCDGNAGEISGQIMKWVATSFNVLDGIEHQDYLGYTMNMLKEDNSSSDDIKKLLKSADFGIEDISYEELELTNKLIEKLEVKNVKHAVLNTLRTIETRHAKYDNDGSVLESVKFNIHKDESTGTQKFLGLSGPIIDSLKEGRVLMIDEIDSSMHPLLTIKIIEMFQDPEINANNAQLIFTTHDTTLLNPCLFRRDQVWFVEKNKFGASNLYSLSDINGVRSTEAFGKQYLNGKYRAIPNINKFEL